MKKRTRQKIKSFFKKKRTVIYGIALCILFILTSINSFVSLHNGASVREVGGHKYSPVVSEILFMIIVGIGIVTALKLLTKLKFIYLALISVTILLLIVWFGVWAFKYTHIDPVEGFLTVLIIAGSVSVFTSIGLWYEEYARRQRKRKGARAKSK